MHTLLSGAYRDWNLPVPVRSSDLTQHTTHKKLLPSPHGLRGRTNLIDEPCLFVTTTCYNWYHLLATNACRQLVSHSINFLKKKYNSATLGYVIMPNHIHLIIYFNKTNQLSNWMRDLKKFTSVRIRQEIEKTGNMELLEKLRLQSENLTYSQRRQVFKVWQDRFDDVYLSSKKVLETKLEYIHTNPLQERWNLANRPELWTDSSAQFYELEKQPPVTIKDYRELF